MTTNLKLEIAPLTAANISQILVTDGGNGWKSDEIFWRQALMDNQAGDRLTLVASMAGTAIGYGSLLWRSGYQTFAAQDIPELNDIAVARSHRGLGVGARLVSALEDSALGAGYTTVGLGVGLYADYGAAQRLYVASGYAPDGKGVTYEGKPVIPGASLPVDDDLLLWLTKSLKL